MSYYYVAVLRFARGKMQSLEAFLEYFPGKLWKVCYEVTFGPCPVNDVRFLRRCTFNPFASKLFTIFMLRISRIYIFLSDVF